MKSPLSDRPPIKVRDLPRSFIIAELEKYYRERPPEDAIECDYTLWRCPETNFEFAWPMRPGNLQFYKWITHFASYYPGVRWEYGEVRRLIGESVKVLDVGCGEGDFLRALGGKTSDRYALDLNEPAIAKCREFGFNSFCGTVDTAVEAGFLHTGEFPVVTSFHCLEHVDDPVEFVRSMLKAVAPGGRLFLSTPYSPMSFESEWFDILNHPPHHMTRWNLRAYEKLAQILGVKMRHFAPPSSPFRRALNTFKVMRYGPHRPVKKQTLLKDLILHSPAFLRTLSIQSQRGKNGDSIAADVILVEFSK